MAQWWYQNKRQTTWQGANWEWDYGTRRWKRSQRLRERSDKFQEALRALEPDEPGPAVDVRQEQPDSWNRSEDEWRMVQDKRQQAVMIKTYRTLLSMATDERENNFLMGMVRAKTEAYRETLPPDERLDKAKEAVAKAVCKLERAKNHSQQAQQQEQKAEEEHDQAVAELKQARDGATQTSPRSPRTASSIRSASTASSAAAVREILKTIQAGASHDEQGNMTFSGGAFATLLSRVEVQPPTEEISDVDEFSDLEMEQEQQGEHTTRPISDQELANYFAGQSQPAAVKQEVMKTPKMRIKGKGGKNVAKAKQ